MLDNPLAISLIMIFVVMPAAAWTGHKLGWWLGGLGQHDELREPHGEQASQPSGDASSGHAG